MTTSTLYFLLLSLAGTAVSLKLPPYLKGCSPNDPNLNKCAKESAIAGIPHFVHGDPKYRIPNMDPIIIDELAVDQGSDAIGLSFIARNASMGGLAGAQVTDIHLDLDKKYVEYHLLFPLVTIRSKYNVTGRVLLLPITGQGDAEIDLKDLAVVYAYNYTVEKKPGKNKEYGVPQQSSIKFDVKGMRIHLYNLFNGNKLLGDNMNSFLNENWKDLVKDVGPAVAEAMGEVMTRILKNIAELVPYDEVFPINP